MNKCTQCGVGFEAKRADARFCSAKCKMQFIRNKRNIKCNKSVTDNDLSVTNVTDNVTDNAVSVSKTVIESVPVIEIEETHEPKKPEKTPYEKLSHLQQALEGNRPGHKPLTMCSKHNCWANTCGCK